MPEKQEYDVVTMDWEEFSKLQVTGEPVLLDPTDDPWSYGAPPPKGVYEVKCFLAKEGISKITPKNNSTDVHFNIAMEAKIISGEWEGTTLFPRLSTRVYRGKGISTAAAWLQKLGVKIPADKPVTPRLIATEVIKRLRADGDAILKAEVDWRGSYEYTDKNGDKQYENVFNSYEEFPENPNKPGTRWHVVKVMSQYTKTLVEVRAMTQVLRFYARNETPQQAANVPVIGAAAASPVLTLQSAPVMQPGGPIAPSGPIITPKTLESPAPAPSQPTNGIDLSADPDLATLLGQ